MDEADGDRVASPLGNCSLTAEADEVPLGVTDPIGSEVAFTDTRRLPR